MGAAMLAGWRERGLSRCVVVEPMNAVVKGGGVEHVRAGDRVDRLAQARPVVRGARLDGDVADRVAVLDLDQVDRADRPAGVSDRARHLAEHARPVIDLDPEGEAVLSTRCGRHLSG